VAGHFVMTRAAAAQPTRCSAVMRALQSPFPTPSIQPAPNTHPLHTSSLQQQVLRRRGSHSVDADETKWRALRGISRGLSMPLQHTA
jgi:hypothetical protein